MVRCIQETLRGHPRLRKPRPVWKPSGGTTQHNPPEWWLMQHVRRPPRHLGKAP